MRKTVAAVTVALIVIFLFTSLSKINFMRIAYAQFEGLPYDPPIVTIVSPSLNTTYSVSDVPFNVTVQIRGFIYYNIERISWLNYSLDGQTAIPMELIVPSNLSPGYYVYGNDALTGLSDGTHNLTIYGETYVGGLTENFNATVSFTVDTSTPPIAFPIVPVTAAFIIVIVVVAGLLVYFKKHGGKNNS